MEISIYPNEQETRVCLIGELDTAATTNQVEELNQGKINANPRANAIGKVKKNAIPKRFFLHMSEKSCTFAAVFGKRKKL